MEEDVGTVRLTVTATSDRDLAPSGITLFDGTTVPGTAVAGSDFTESSGFSYFLARDFSAVTENGETRYSATQNLDISILDDQIAEGTETFTMSISPVRGHSVTLGAREVTITVNDDDTRPTVTLSLSDASIEENGGSTTVTASLDRASSVATTVVVSAAPVSPATGSDYGLSQNGTR